MTNYTDSKGGEQTTAKIDTLGFGGAGEYTIVDDIPGDNEYLETNEVPRQDQLNALQNVSGRAVIEWVPVQHGRLLPVLDGVPLVVIRTVSRYDYERTGAEWEAKYDVPGVGTVEVSCSHEHPDNESYIEILDDE